MIINIKQEENETNSRSFINPKTADEEAYTQGSPNIANENPHRKFNFQPHLLYVFDIMLTALIQTK